MDSGPEKEPLLITNDELEHFRVRAKTLRITVSELIRRAVSLEMVAFELPENYVAYRNRITDERQVLDSLPERPNRSAPWRKVSIAMPQFLSITLNIRSEFSGSATTGEYAARCVYLVDPLIEDPDIGLEVEGVGEPRLFHMEIPE
ncbi:MAG TPA: hypothetical protein VK694_04920 [Verrucomicrobiae bacterium]|nr:hypothetical protein [Verrucomicrobiae bacterium]